MEKFDEGKTTISGKLHKMKIFLALNENVGDFSRGKDRWMEKFDDENLSGIAPGKES